MEENTLLTEKELEQQLNILKEFEKDLMVQLDNLASKMPELYQGYANLVRETFAAAFDIISVSPEKSEKIGLAVEVLSRGIEAYGAYKAAKKHNEQLDKYLRIKQSYASLNQSKLERLQREIERKIPRSEKLFDQFALLKFDFSNKSEDLIIRQANLSLRYLTLYRTNRFLLDISKYLLKEFAAWSAGRQTSGKEKPDYYGVNTHLMKKLYGGASCFEILEKICDQNKRFTGADLLLLSDPQLCIYALQNVICEIDINAASPVVRVLMANNPGFQHYVALTEDIKGHMTKDPSSKIWKACAIAGIATALLVLSYFPSEGYKWWVLIISLGAIFRIGHVNSKKAKIKHIIEGEQKTDEADANLLQLCGYVEVDEIDYERKNTTSELIKGFFNI